MCSNQLKRKKNLVQESLSSSFLLLAAVACKSPRLSFVCWRRLKSENKNVGIDVCRWVRVYVLADAAAVE